MSCECAHCGAELEGIDFAHEDSCLDTLDSAAILAELDRALVEYDHTLDR